MLDPLIFFKNGSINGATVELRPICSYSISLMIPIDVYPFITLPIGTKSSAFNGVPFA